MIDAHTGAQEIYGGVVHGELGWSTTAGKPVAQAIGELLPHTIELVVWSIPIICTGVWFGMPAAYYRDQLIDRMLRALSMFGNSFHAHVFGPILLLLFVTLLSGPFIGGFPDWTQAVYDSSGFLRFTGMTTFDALLNGRFDFFVLALQHMLLPILALSYFGWAVLLNIARSAVLDAGVSKEAIGARSQGGPEPAIARESVWPRVKRTVIASSGTVASGLLDVVIVAEVVFKQPGLGALLVQAVVHWDVITALGILLFGTTAILIVKLMIDIVRAITVRRTRRSFSPRGAA